MQGRLVGPEALEEPVAVLLEAAVVDVSGGEALRGPSCLAVVVDSGPHEVADHEVIDIGIFPPLLGIHKAGRRNVVGPAEEASP